MPKSTGRGLNIFLLTVSLITGLLVCEYAARLIRPASDIFPADPAADPILGIRILPFQSGHDARGFRNTTAEGYFPVVFIGDSQVYGVGVPRKYAIPQQVSRMLHKPVYNMGLGSYGPVQYYQLLKESRPMHPQQTIIAFFLGNDLLDAYHMATDCARWQWLGKEMGDAAPFDAIPPCARAYQPPRGDDFQLTPELITEELKKGGSPLWQVHSFLRLHSALYALQYEGAVKPLVQHLFERQKHLQLPGAFHSADVDTVFVPEVNLKSLHPQDRRVRGGLLITRKIIELMGGVQKDNKGLLLTIIPTKENVYYEFLKGKNAALPPEYECAVYYERAITRWLIDVITANGIPFQDLLPAMQAAAAQGARLYPASTDAHPNAAGNRVIATVLAQALQEQPH